MARCIGISMIRRSFVMSPLVRARICASMTARSRAGVMARSLSGASVLSSPAGR